jgi:hypothetical protein
MPAPAEMRAGNAQYDDPLRGVLLHTDGPPVAGVRTADDEIISAGGQAGRPNHGAWLVPGAATSFRIPGHFRAVSRGAHSPVSRPASGNASDSASWPPLATLRSPPPGGEGRATKEGKKR